MRLHRLEVQAFGSFATRQVVDFDELSESGLFLVHGDTGAGKTTLLDAVAYALYGEVPGVRRTDGLRSHHAPVALPPEVHLEVTLGARRFRITRTPRWERPKRSGGGTTTQQPTVLVEELVEGSWTNGVTRLDEAGQLVTDQLGMGASQFRQVVMLPQGGFAEFLRSGAKERAALLEQLFDTGRFNDVEAWLAERARELRDRIATTEGELHANVEEVTRHLHRALDGDDAEAADAAPTLEGTADTGPDALAGTGSDDVTAGTGPDATAGTVRDDPSAGTSTDDHAPSEASTDAVDPHELPLEALPGWVDAHHASAVDRAASCASTLERTGGQLAGAVAALEDANALVARQARHAAALARSADLTAAEDDQRARRDELEAARRAVRVEVPLVTLERCRTNAADDEQRLAAARAAVVAFAPHLATAGPDDLEDAVGGAVVAHSVADELVALEAVVAARATTIDQGAVELAAAEEALADHEREREDLPQRLDAAREQLGSATLAAAAVEGLGGAVTDAEDRLVDASRRDELADVIAEAATVHATARDHHQAARDLAQDLRERRIQQMAAELAAGLEPGHDCPVCGATEHPEPARPGDAGLVAPEEVDAAEEAVCAREARRDAAHEHLRDLTGERDALLARCGDLTVEDARANRDRAGAAHREAVATAAMRGAARDEVAHLEAAVESVAARIAEAHAEIGRRRAELERLEADQVAERRRIDDGVGGHTGPAAMRDELARRLTALRACHRAVTAAAASAAELAAQEAATDDAVREAGFPDRAHATGAIRTSEAIDRLQARLDEHEAAVATVRSTLEDPELVDAAARPVPDLDGLAAQRRADDDVHQRAVRAHTRADDLVAALDHAAERIHRLVHDLGPVAEDHATVHHLARLAAGASPDNPLRMKLATYVLAAILEEVAEAANGHLARMSSDRYSFVYSDAVGDGRRQSGLGLLVHDAWNQTEREATTLSGGETFFASLALALGLAEVVTAASGGIRIDTLFIDEGFGSLDEDTLHDVMETLDELRDGGRAIGIVSHVGALRDRITTHVHVTKTPTGSTVRTDVAAV